MIQPKVNHLSFMGAKHKTNDDYVLINQEQGVYIVCDGVSEGGNGRFASELIAKRVQEQLTHANHFIQKNGALLLGPKRLQKMQELLLGAFAEAQTSLVKMGETDPNYRNAHTTCLTLWIDGRFAILAHLGDSRAYLYRTQKVYQLTKDHNGYDELPQDGDAARRSSKKSYVEKPGSGLWITLHATRFVKN